MASFRRIFPLSLPLLLLLILPGGCAGGGRQTPAPEPASLDWYINFSWFSTAWGGNLVSDTITEETDTSIHFISPSGNEGEKLGSMMRSDTLSDLITLGYWEPQISEMILAGQVWALNELADAYCPSFWEAAEPQRVAWYTEADGNIYAYPNSSYSPADYEAHDNIGSNQAFLVRRDIYEAIGSPDMSTPEGFLAAVRAAAARFPTVGGQPLIPVGLYEFDKDGCFSLEEILMNFLAIPFERDGGRYDRYTDPDYIVWLKVFRRLCSEGFFPDEVFIDRRVQTAEKVAQGRYFCMLYQHTDIADQQKLLYAQSPGSQYIAVDGPKNAAGDDHVLPGVGINGWTVTLISKNCKDPARALEMMAYMMGEHGQKLLYCGVEGVTFDTVNGRPVPRPDVLELLNRDRAEYNRLYGADNTYWMLQDLAMQLSWQPEPQPPLDQPRQWTCPYTRYLAQYEITYPAGSEALNAHQNIREVWGETLPALLLSESDEAFDALFEAFLQKRDTLGFAVAEREADRQFKATREKLRGLSQAGSG